MNGRSIIDTPVFEGERENENSEDAQNLMSPCCFVCSLYHDGCEHECQIEQAL